MSIHCIEVTANKGYHNLHVRTQGSTGGVTFHPTNRTKVLSISPKLLTYPQHYQKVPYSPRSTKQT